jgi:hypothetical protein
LPTASRAAKKTQVKLRESATSPRALALAGFCLAVSVTAGTLPASPSVAELLSRIAERAQGEAARDAAFKARYAYTRDRMLEVRDGSGELQKREPRHIQHRPAPPATNQPPATADGQTSPDTTSRKPRAYERRDFQLDRDLLARFRFELAGSLTNGDRLMWRLNFQPAPQGRSIAGVKEHFLSHIAGSAWVDAVDAEIVRLEVRLTAPVPVVGGLVGSVKACWAVSVRERTPDGCWFTRRLTWHVEGRQFFRTKVMDFTEEIREVHLAGM